MQLEKLFINQCAPTLASLKTGSLFTIYECTYSKITNQIKLWNDSLKDKSVTIILLNYKLNKALVYVYRKDKLQQDLNNKEAIKFLKSCGYTSNRYNYAIETLKSKLEKSDTFPHEIGLFLGYPIGDVLGFIHNKGKNSLCAGCWKVYCNKCDALEKFRRYKKCKAVYNRLWEQGRTIKQLTVA